MQKILSILYIIIFLSTHLTFAQEKEDKEIKKFLKEGDKLIKDSDFHEALSFFQKVLVKDKNHKEGNFKVGFCYLHSMHREKSLSFFQKVYEEDENYLSNLEELYEIVPEEIQNLEFYLAQSYHFSSMFSEATEHYIKAIQAYEAKKNHKKTNKSERELYEQKIKTCQKLIGESKHGEIFINEPVNAQITNVGKIINSKYADYVPVISADESILVFTSRREGSVGGKKDLDGEYFEDIYISYHKNGEWTEPKNIGEPVNTKFHDASVAVSPDGQQIFIYKDDNKGTGDIYVTTHNKNDNTWTKPKSLGKNINSKYHEASISVTSDGKTAYFSSNRPDGLGELDIYVSHKDEKGEWGKAINLGKEINTPYSDDAPFITADGKTLYFSSKGHKTMGGYDIFRTHLENGKWTTPENLGYPINTSDDDIYFVLSESGKNGYYSSAKEGGYGDKDIYLISMPQKKVAKIKMDTEITTTARFTPVTIKNIDTRPKLILRGTIRDKVTKETLEANVEIGFLESKDLIEDTKSSSEGAYKSNKVDWEKKYLISVEKEGYLFHSESFVTPKNEGTSQEVVVDVELRKLTVGASINLIIFYAFDKANLRKESNAELARLLAFMKQYPNVDVEIAGHTDNIGTDQKNIILSKQRAKSVVNFLKKNGIDSKRMVYQGYGFHKPIAPNQNPDGSDNPEGRQLNRRTECVIRAIR